MGDAAAWKACGGPGDWPDVESTRKADGHVVIVSAWGCIRERRWKMFEGRAVRVVLISLLSTDEARGANSICASVLDLL